MEKLICNLSECESIKNRIKSYVREYDLILALLESLENDTENIWKSESQRAYFEQFIERKAELEKLSSYYEELVSFLNDVFKTYQNIEAKYS